MVFAYAYFLGGLPVSIAAHVMTGLVGLPFMMKDPTLETIVDRMAAIAHIISGKEE